MPDTIADGAVGSNRKPVVEPEVAMASVDDGAVVLVGGWGGVGVPTQLLVALADAAVSDLTIVSNNCGMGRENDVGVLFAAGRARRAITSFPTHPSATAFREQLSAGRLELELVPQGTLVERLRCAGAGLGAFFTPTGARTELAEGKEERVLDGRPQILETALRGDVALIHAHQADVYGNLTYRYIGGGFNATMATAADLVVAQVEELRDEPIPPDEVHTPGIFVDLLTVVRGGV